MRSAWLSAVTLFPKLMFFHKHTWSTNIKYWVSQKGYYMCMVTVRDYHSNISYTELPKIFSVPWNWTYLANLLAFNNCFIFCLSFSKMTISQKNIQQFTFICSTWRFLWCCFLADKFVWIACKIQKAIYFAVWPISDKQQLWNVDLIIMIAFYHCMLKLKKVKLK
jgi:hypothetical protein